MSSITSPGWQYAVAHREALDGPDSVTLQAVAARLSETVQCNPCWTEAKLLVVLRSLLRAGRDLSPPNVRRAGVIYDLREDRRNEPAQPFGQEPAAR